MTAPARHRLPAPARIAAASMALRLADATKWAALRSCTWRSKRRTRCAGVTGDTDLLAPGEGAPVESPADFLRRLT